MAALSLDRVTLARRLGADPDHLEQFVVNHPDPSAGVVLRSAVTSKPPRRVSGETRDLLGEWIADRKERQRDGPRRRIVEYLDEHGPAHLDVLLDAVTAPDSTRPAPVMGALYALEDGGHVVTTGVGAYRLAEPADCGDTNE